MGLGVEQKGWASFYCNIHVKHPYILCILAIQYSDTLRTRIQDPDRLTVWRYVPESLLVLFHTTIYVRHNIYRSPMRVTVNRQRYAFKYI